MTSARLALVALCIGSCLFGCGASDVDKKAPTDAGTLPKPTLDCAALSAPLYERVRSDGGDSILTTDAAEAAQASNDFGYTDDRGVAFLVATDGGTGLMPAYRLYNPSASEHLWTMDTAEKATAMSEDGFTEDEGIGFYASVLSNACLVGVHRFVKTGSTQHRYVTASSEMDSLTSGGWRDEGVRLWAAPAP